MGKDCIFCKIISGEIESKKFYEDDLMLCFYDIHPKAPVHVLLVPKKHIVSLAKVEIKDKDLLGHIQLKAGEIAKKLGIAEAFRLLTSSGKKAGQSVAHLHYHLIGGWENNSEEMEANPESL